MIFKMKYIDMYILICIYVRYGHEKCMELLLENGGDLNLKNRENWCPLHVAIRQGGLQGVQKLLELGADVNRTGGNGF